MGKGKLGAFLLGGAIGAVVALLVAPRTGVETRAIVGERVNSAWTGARDFGTHTGAQAQQVYQNVAARGQEFAQVAASRGQEFAQAAASRGQDFVHNAAAGVQKAVHNVRTAAQPINNDELRDKIEAARQRIASQVMRNAAESNAVVDSVINVAAEPVPVSNTPQSTVTTGGIQTPGVNPAPSTDVANATSTPNPAQPTNATGTPNVASTPQQVSPAQEGSLL